MDISASMSASDFDRKLEAERARWLRRRFLWFCGIVGLLDLLAAPFIMVPAIVAKFEEANPSAGGMNAVWLHRTHLLASMALVGVAFLYVLLRPPTREMMLKLAAVVTAAGGAMSLIASWAEAGLVDEFNVGAWVRLASWAIFLHHLPACLFLPWTPRECLRPGVVLLAMNGLVLGVQMPRGIDAGIAVVAVVLSPLLLTPGLFVCWVRQARFRSRFRLLFESEAYRRLQGELASARRIHDMCLPVPLLDGPVCLQYAYAPMQQIGGDLLFVPPGCAKAEDGRVSVVLLDVTGHGVAAALTVNRLVGELERIYGESADASPRDVLCGLNRYVHLTLARHGVFVSALCVRADAERGTVQWASGGHPTAFLRRADGRVEDLESTGMLLGAMDGAEYCPDEAELPFDSGDAVLAYTDGAAEARDAQGAALRTDGLRSLVSALSGNGVAPGLLPGAVMRTVVSQNSEGPEDDILVLSLYRPAMVRAGARAHEPVPAEAVTAG
jgi:serine phosphatase RsbU (regulator of sigma subunit)